MITAEISYTHLKMLGDGQRETTLHFGTTDRGVYPLPSNRGAQSWDDRKLPAQLICVFPLDGGKALGAGERLSVEAQPSGAGIHSRDCKFHDRRSQSAF